MTGAAAVSTIRRMAARPRKELDPGDLNNAFGLHFRALLDKSGLSVTELRERLAEFGQEFSDSGVRKWMRGESFPTPDVMVTLAEIFRLSDYRDILPKIGRSSK